MKTAILIWVIGYYPVSFVFDTYDACYELELSLKRLISTNIKLTPRQITMQVKHVEYVCPHCSQKTSYDTDSIPTKNTCHQCLKTIDFEDINN